MQQEKRRYEYYVGHETSKTREKEGVMNVNNTREDDALARLFFRINPNAAIRGSLGGRATVRNSNIGEPGREAEVFYI